VVEGGDESEHCATQAEAEAEAITITSFQPFFTLIEDSVTNEHHHPTVHYIFADDDSDIIAEAACRSLEALDPSQRASGQHHEDPRLPPPIAGGREHYLVLDVHPRFQAQAQDSGPTAPTYEVVSAQSFSSDWQVLRSSITTAPTIGEGEDDALMLRIEGRGNTPGGVPATAEKESMEEMIERFQRRLEDIRQVMEATPTGEGQAGGAGTGTGVDD